VTTKQIAWIAGIAAAIGLGLAWNYREKLKAVGGIPMPPATPTLPQAKQAQAVNALAAAQVVKGAKAVAEAAKVAQIGEVRAQDRTAEKSVLKGG
jgi:hypothetical protein